MMITALAIGTLLFVANRVLHSPGLPSKRLRWIVLTLRLLVFACLFLVLFNPVRRQGLENEKAHCPAVFLVDTSASMDLETPTRASRVRDAIVEACIAMGPRAQPQIFVFDQDLSATTLSPSDLPTSPDGSSTLLARGLSSALERARGAGAPRVVVFSDGQAHDEARLGRAVHLALSTKVPVCVYPVGVPPDRPNLAILNCIVERHVPAESTVPIRAVVQFTRMTDTEVFLRLKDASGEIVDEISFVAVEGIHEKLLHGRVEYAPATFTVEIEPVSAELSLEDNHFTFSVAVSDPGTRVLYMEGSNHRDKRWEEKWEYEFIAEALRETGKIEVDILTVDEQLAEGGKLYNVADPKVGFPTRREDLMAYDVVICSDVNLSLFTPDQLAWTVDLVAKQGGGFCMIGGYTAFGAGKWDKTVWEKMIPVDMQTEKEGYVWENFTPDIPAAVRSHPIWRMMSDPEANSAILDQHPEFLGVNLINREKPAATILARYAKRDMPIICVQAYGRGRTMSFLSDAAGGWGEKYQTEWGEGDKDNRYYRRFWSNTVRWLAANSAARYQSELIGTTEAVNYRPGSTVPVRVYKPNQPNPERLAKLQVSAQVEGSQNKAILQWDESSASFRGEIQLLEQLDIPDLDILFTATDAAGKSVGEDRVPIRLLQTNREFENPSPNKEVLVRLAELTGGTVLKTKQDLKALLQESDQDESRKKQPFSVPVWDQVRLWLLAIALLTAEWLIRKVVSMRGTS